MVGGLGLALLGWDLLRDGRLELVAWDVRAQGVVLERLLL